MQDDKSYFARRAAQERAAASSATDPKVRSAHEQMAGRYQALLSTDADGKAAEADATA